MIVGGNCMVDLNNIKQFSVTRPNGFTLFGSPEDFDTLPQEHKDQIIFLDRVASRYIYEFVASAKLVTGEAWQPFSKGNFKTVEEFCEFSDNPDSEQRLKKWLFNRSIPFRTWVFVLPNYSDHPVYTTWKMIVKYSKRLFFADDLTIFDQTLNWCLFYFHEDRLFFGKDNIYDPAASFMKMEELNELRKKYPQFKFPY